MAEHKGIAVGGEFVLCGLHRWHFQKRHHVYGIFHNPTEVQPSDHWGTYMREC